MVRAELAEVHDFQSWSVEGSAANLGSHDEAVGHAEKAAQLTGYSVPSILDTIAMTQAAARRIQ